MTLCFRGVVRGKVYMGGGAAAGGLSFGERGICQESQEGEVYQQ